MRIHLTIGMLAVSLAICGCSTFTTELKSKNFTGADTPGFTYKLPTKQFSLSATYQVTGCRVTSENKVNLDADVKATLSERLVGAEAYTISYQDLDTWTKITNMEFHLSEAGLLTGINTKIADQTGAVIQNIVSTATGIARAVALPPVELTTSALRKQDDISNKISNVKQLMSIDKQDEASSQLHSLEGRIPTIAGDTTSRKENLLLKNQLNERLNRFEKLANQSACNEVNQLSKAHDEAQAALKTEQKKDKERDTAKRKKGEAEAEIARLSALKDVYDALGKEAAKNGLMTRIQEQEKRQADAESELKSLGTSGTDKAAETLANVAASLSITSMIGVLPQKSGDEFAATVTDNDIPPALRASFKNTTTVLPKVTLKVLSLTDAPAGKNPAQTSGDRSMGIAYRIPVAAMAKVSCECKNGTRTLIEQPTEIPQFGPVGSFDLKNGAFANNTLEVAFSKATGAPEKLVFHSTSRAEAASASARDAANSYLQLQKDKRDDIRAANKSAIDQQTALLALEKTRNEVALANSQAAATAALLPVTTEKTLVEAQINLLRDQQRLDAVRTGTASAAEVQLEALVNQQKLLEQQLKIMQIEQQIAEQKAKVQTNIAP